MKRAFVAMLVVVLTAGTVTAATADQAPLSTDTRGNVQIVKLQFNVPGPDTWYNAKYEWVALKNLGNVAMNIDKWTVEDATGNTFTFLGDSAWDVPGNAVIELDPVLLPGQTVVVHTGRNVGRSADLPGAVNLYWGRRGHVWANTGKESVLVYDATGVRIDRLTYDDNTITP